VEDDDIIRNEIEKMAWRVTQSVPNLIADLEGQLELRASSRAIGENS
jgi:hypothetical protein